MHEVPGSSFVSYDSNSAEDISSLTSSQSTLASDIVNVDEDNDGSSTGSKVVSIPTVLNIKGCVRRRVRGFESCIY